MSEKKFCNQCGNELKENAKFCSHCGAPVPTEPTVETESPEGANKKSRRRLVIIIAIVAIIVVIIVCLLVARNRNGATPNTENEIATTEADEAETDVNDIATENDTEEEMDETDTKNTITNTTEMQANEDAEEQRTGMWGYDRIAYDGVTVLFEYPGYTDERITYLEDSAKAMADKFCCAAFNFNEDGRNITSALSPLLSGIEGGFDEPEAFDKIFAGTDANLTYYWYTPSFLYVAYDDTYGDCINTFGFARVHMKSSKIKEGDYDIYVHLILVEANGEWKIYQITTGDMYTPDEATIVQNESFNWILDVDKDPVASFDITNPEGYLTDYMYDRYVSESGTE